MKSTNFKKITVSLSIFVGFVFFNSCQSKSQNESIEFSISYLRDDFKKEKIQTVTGENFLPMKSPNLGFKNGTYWFKVQLKDPLPSKNIVFHLSRNTINNIVIFNEKQKLPFEILEKTTPTLLVQHQDSNTYFLKVDFDKQVFFDLSIEPLKIVQANTKYWFLKNGMYYGFVFMVIIINLFFYSSLKERSFLLYALFLSSMALTFSTYDGFINLFFNKEMVFYLDKMIHYLVGFFGVLFANHFLDLKKFQPKSYLMGGFLLLILAMNYLLFFITGNNFFISLGDTTGVIALFYYWLLGVAIFKEHEFAKFFVLGYSLILFFLIFFVIPSNWGINMPYVTLSSMKMGSFFEMLILSYAITYRTKTLQNENRKYKNEIIDYIKKLESFHRTSNNFLVDEKTSLKEKFNLSERELEVLTFIQKGYTNQRISKELLITINTTKFHIRNIYEKLNISSKNEAIDILSSLNK